MAEKMWHGPIKTMDTADFSKESKGEHVHVRDGERVSCEKVGCTDKVERMHCGLVDGLMRPKADGAYVYYEDYARLERELAELRQKFVGMAFQHGVELHEAAQSATRRSTPACYQTDGCPDYDTCCNAGQCLTLRTADSTSAGKGEGEQNFYCQAGGCETQCVNCADEQPAPLESTARGKER